MNDDDRITQDDFNRLTDSIALLINVQKTSAQNSARAIADALMQVAMQLSRADAHGHTVAPMPNQTFNESDDSVIKWFDQKRPMPRDHWLGRRFVIRAIWEVDQYLMSNLGRFIGRMVEDKDLISNLGRFVGRIVADKYLMDSLSSFVHRFMEEVDRYLMDNLSRFVGRIVQEGDRYITPMIHKHIGPYIDWMVQLLRVGISWLGNLFNAAIQWFASAVQGSIVFMRDLIIYLYDTTIKSLVRDLLDTVVYPFLLRTIGRLIQDVTAALVGVFSGFLLALGNVLWLAVLKFTDALIAAMYAWGNVLKLAVLKFIDAVSGFLHALSNVFMLAAEWIAYGIISVLAPALNMLGLNVTPLPPTESFSAAIARGWQAGTTRGQESFEDAIARGFGAGPTRGQESFEDAIARGFGAGLDLGQAISTKLFTDLAALLGLGRPGQGGAETGTPPQEPRFELPPFEMPRPVLPEPPTGAGAITLNGDINVSIAAAAVDTEHADDVARQIASRVLEEIHRLIEIERFSRGLPANGTP